MGSNKLRLAEASCLCNLCVLLVNDVISGDPLSEPRWTVDFEPHEGNIRAVVNSHHHEISNLEKSALQGCRLCCFLRDCLAASKSNRFAYIGDIYYLQPGNLTNSLEVCRGNSVTTLTGTTFYYFDRYSTSELADAADLKYGALPWTSNSSYWYWNVSLEMTVARGTCPDPASSITLALLNRWLDDCKTHHKECKRSISKPPLPTRVINVGTKDSDPFLYTSIGENADYITLSYAWGGDVLSKTIMSNLRERQESIPEITLPQAFRDAFIIARGLNIQYVWIDALCIVQDDSEDWLRESVLMSQVYENCTLMISATKSNKCESGFLQPRANPEQEIGTYMDVVERPLHVRVAQSNVHRIQGPLNDRGWTFQERLLSLAVLHFTDDGIYWECKSICVNDSGARLNCNVELKAMYAPEDWSFGGGEKYESASGFGNFWSGIVENYCKRALTFPQDKLVALSGIAQRYQVRTNGKYVAGLWEHKLMRWLLWQRSKTAAWGLQVFGQRSSIYRAPSWSWASLDGSFKYDRFIFEDDPVPCPSLAFQIQSYFIQEESPGACGTISYSHLTIKGLLYKATYNIMRHSIYREYLYTEIGTWDCLMDALIYPKDEIERKEYCWVMPVAIWREGHWAGIRHLRLWGLVFGRPRGVFQPLPGDLMRLGTATMSLPRDYDGLPDGAEYASKGSIVENTLDQSETFSDHFPGNEKRPEEHKIDEDPSFFYSEMDETEKFHWEERMNELHFDRNKIRTVRIV